MTKKLTPKQREAKRTYGRKLAKKRPHYAHWYSKPRWREVRAKMLARHPVCQELGCEEPATQVDHKVAHHGDPRLFYDQGNLTCLCLYHHSSKTARLDSSFAPGGKDPAIGACDVNGLPLSPQHPWHPDYKK